MRLTRFIPPWIFPQYWILGKEDKELFVLRLKLSEPEYNLKYAEIKYGKDSPKYKKALLEIRHQKGEIDENDYLIGIYEQDLVEKGYDERTIAKHLLDKKRELNLITEDDYQIEKMKLEKGPESVEAKLCELDIKLKKGLISEKEYEKQKATILGEPWIEIVGFTVGAEDGAPVVEFEFDWNEHFIAALRENGYRAATPDRMVEDWFNDLCKTILVESGETEFLEELTVRRNPTRITKEHPLDDNESGLTAFF